MIVEAEGLDCCLVPIEEGISLSDFVDAACVATKMHGRCYVEAPDGERITAETWAPHDGDRVCLRLEDSEVAHARLVHSGVDVPASDEERAAAVYTALNTGDFEAASLWYEAGLLPPAAWEGLLHSLCGLETDYSDGNILELPSLATRLQAVQSLLSFGVWPDARNARGETAVYGAARGGKTELVRALLAHGAAVDVCEPAHGKTALMDAAARENFEALATLLEHGASTTLTDNAGMTALDFAIRALLDNVVYDDPDCREDTRATTLLVQHGADVDSRGGGGLTPLMRAASEGDEYAVLAGCLLDLGADPNARAEGCGKTPLMWAVGRSGSVAVTDLLLTHGADVRARAADGTTALMTHVAAFRQWWRDDVLQLLLAAGADVNARDDAGQTALLHLVRSVAFDSSGYKANARISTRSNRIIEALVAAGAELNIPDAGGYTPLMVAVEGVPGLVPGLLAQGADLAATTPSGVSAADLARVLTKKHLDECACPLCCMLRNSTGVVSINSMPSPG
eukprot:TRINITY_DN9466_c0_g2_i1.p1 TRINITY_DN9466_c0_g2~~TRINITY_DN9466_c0_g2_i1.p1  ORF type:complete len:512 (+),score=50.81 TRINITY_DN9466_c0_g2_i1:208-1743(+)